MDGLSHRISLFAVLLGAAFVGVELGGYFLRDVKDVESIGRKQIIVREFGEGTLVAQSFLVARDGLRTMTVSVWSDGPAAVTFELDLFRRGNGPSEEVAKRVVEVSKTSGITRQTIEFPPISPAKGREFVARFQLTRAVAPDAASAAGALSRPLVGLVAWADNPLPTGTLSVGNNERWGDLDFSAEATPPTRLQRMVDAVNSSLPAVLRLNEVSAFLLVILLCAIMVAVAAVAVAAAQQGHEKAAQRLPPTTVAVDRRPAPPSLARGITSVRSMGAVALCVAAPALFLSVLASRERVAVDLMDDLDQAVMESPAGMHGAFSLWQEAINGYAPPALFAHPPSRITWTVTVPTRKPLLKTNAALRPYVWQQRSDGVTFTIAVEEGANVATLSSRFVNPGQNLSDRAWVEMDADLSQYAGRSVRLVLSTSPGPAGDPGWDWAMWGHPRIVER